MPCIFSLYRNSTTNFRPCHQTELRGPLGVPEISEPKIPSKFFRNLKIPQREYERSKETKFFLTLRTVQRN